MLRAFALLGVLSISFSAVFVRLAAVSPVTATFFRAAYAVPVLAIVWTALRQRDRRTWRERAVAFGSGLILAVDLALWHESIGLIGAGLGTVIANVQVVFVALTAWLLFDEKPRARTMTVVAIVLVGVALTSGLARPDAYGTHPVAGVAIGVVAGVAYAAFLLVFRASTQSESPTVGPLLDSTVGVVAGALVCAAVDPHFSLIPSWPAHGWLILLALVSQVIGWMLITTALPRLPAIETSIMLLGQPAAAIVWGVLFFAERLSPLQWIGTAVVLAGVAMESVVGNR